MIIVWSTALSLVALAWTSGSLGTNAQHHPDRDGTSRSRLLSGTDGICNACSFEYSDWLLTYIKPTMAHIRQNDMKTMLDARREIDHLASPDLPAFHAYGVSTRAVLMNKMETLSMSIATRSVTTGIRMHDAIFVERREGSCLLQGLGYHRLGFFMSPEFSALTLKLLCLFDPLL